MQDYTIYCDSACDIIPEQLAQWGVKYQELSYRFGGDNNTYMDNDLHPKAFYDKMRAGVVAKTAAVNAETFRRAFETELKEGKDVLYLGFSSGLSSTYNAGRLAMEQLVDEYPERKMIAVDTLCASAGYGLLLYLAVNEKNSGKSIEEVAAFAENIKLKICHWFTVSDLVYLKRGGRISSATAMVGGVLGIKPVLHMDDAGTLQSVTKVRGRKASLEEIVRQYAQTAEVPSGGTVFASHGDCIEDARMLEEMLFQNHGVRFAHITNVGAVIGSHSGPGTIALFYVGKKR
ncbi:MAG: DegV family protein [Ruminococcaceae bacterium]|nr:DegV family protein [Oscillospiraceae bacterium]